MEQATQEGWEYPPCPGCKRILNWPYESGRWRVMHQHYGDNRSTPGLPLCRMAPNTTCPEFCWYQHEHQDQWVDCLGPVEATSSCSRCGGTGTEVYEGQDGLKARRPCLLCTAPCPNCKERTLWRSLGFGRSYEHKNRDGNYTPCPGPAVFSATEKADIDALDHAKWLLQEKEQGRPLVRGEGQHLTREVPWPEQYENLARFAVEAAVEIERLQHEVDRLQHDYACMLDHATGGRMSQTAYDLSIVRSVIDEHVQEIVEQERDDG